MSTMPASEGPLHLGKDRAAGIRVHERTRHRPELPAGPIIRLDDGSLYGVAGNPAWAYRSPDDGASWRKEPLFPEDGEFASAPTGALLNSANGTIVLAFANLATKHWPWDAALRDAPGARLPTCVMRSLDGGQTWQDLQTLHEEWTGATRDILQTRDGRIVFTSMKMQHDPGRHSVLCYVSDDDAATWQASNVMDLGGNGHHDGLTEGTILELTDGRLLQYVRTNWGQLWRALSVDGGLHWHPYGPSGIPASSTPAMLKRLRSGRVLLLWNRPLPQDGHAVPLMGGDGIWSATPASNFRAELSMSFSEDETETWTPPVVIARNDNEERQEICYPYAFEARPGELWITAHRWDLRMSLHEQDFLP